MYKKIRAAGALALALLWLVLTAFTWFSPAKKSSASERRILTQMPKLDKREIMSGRFFEGFEKYTNDQFPARDFFRTVKAITHRYGLWQMDNNDYYLEDGYLSQQNYPLDQASLTAAMTRLQYLYSKYIEQSDSKVYCAIIPDKNYYLAEKSGHLAIDYDAMLSQVQNELPFAQHIGLTDLLSVENFYYTDTHWRQETLLPVAERLCQAMEMTVPNAQEFTPTSTGQPFYGVYHGQAALPLKPDTMYLMESQRLSDCKVSTHNMMTYVPLEYSGVYDLDRLNSKEPYDVFLSGTNYSVIRIDNPNATTDRELVIFRDSFGSSIAPLLVSEYRSVILLDVRYFHPDMLSRYVQFDKQDVLFLFSTLVLNSGMIS